MRALPLDKRLSASVIVLSATAVKMPAIRQMHRNRQSAFSSFQNILIILLNLFFRIMYFVTPRYCLREKACHLHLESRPAMANESSNMAVKPLSELSLLSWFHNR